MASLGEGGGISVIMDQVLNALRVVISVTSRLSCCLAINTSMETSFQLKYGVHFWLVVWLY